MAIRSFTIPPITCFARLICLEDEAKLKRIAEAKPTNGREAIQAFQELLVARRQRSRHEQLCPVCQQEDQRLIGRRNHVVQPRGQQVAL